MAVIDVAVKETTTHHIKKTACDRCSKIIEDQKFGYYDDAHEGRVVIVIDHRNQGGATVNKYDLCDLCSKQLKQWIEVKQ